MWDQVSVHFPLFIVIATFFNLFCFFFFVETKNFSKDKDQKNGKKRCLEPSFEVK